MPVYAKIWTEIESDNWFVGLSCLQRGVWLQLIVMAKNRGDTGELSFRSWRAAGESLGLDAGTCKKTLRFFSDPSEKTASTEDTRKKSLRDFSSTSKIILEEVSNGTLRIVIPKYHYYQHLRKPKEYNANCDIPAVKPAEIRQLSEQSITEHSISEQSISDITTVGTLPEAGQSAAESQSEKGDEWTEAMLKDYKARKEPEPEEEERRKCLELIVAYLNPEYLPYAPSIEAKRYELAGWVVKTLKEHPRVAVEFMHDKIEYLAKLKDVTAFRKMVTTINRDPETMGRIRSAAYRQF